MSTFCDSHVHIVGDRERYPWVANRTYTAPPATLAQLQAAAHPCGVGRFVIVQPSFYGTDNRATLEAVEALGAAGRGIAVIDPAHTSDAALQDMNARGIRGLRINLYSMMATGMPALEQSFLPVRDVASGWQMDSVENLIALPGNQQTYLSQVTRPILPFQQGPHPFYDADVAGRLAVIASGGASKPAPALRAALLALEREMERLTAAGIYNPRLK